ncbi:unnamed protein product, partial [Meganyctiphanes norvegica]
MTDKAMNDLFEEQWNEWIETLSFPTIENQKNIKDDISDILMKIFTMNGKECQKTIDSLNKEVSIIDLTTIPTPDDSDYQIQYSLVTLGLNVAAHSLGFTHGRSVEKIKCYTLDIMKKAVKYLNEIKEKLCQDYDKDFILHICKLVEDEFKIFNGGKKTIKLNKSYQIKVTIQTLTYAIPFFEKLHSQYIKKNDPKNILIDNYKSQVRNIFMGTYTQCKNETAANMLGDTLSNAILSSLKRDLTQTIADSFSLHNKFPSKLSLYAKVMEDLFEKKDFGMYIRFINDTNTAMESWIEMYVLDYCMETEERGKNRLEKQANEILEAKVEALTKCVNKMSKTTKNISFQVWLQNFFKCAQEIVPFSETVFNIFYMKEVEVTNFIEFEKKLIENLEKVKKNLASIFRTGNLEALNSLDEKPHISIAKNILGCTKRCPLCYVICIKASDHPGEHSAPYHYPLGVAGVHDEKTKELVLETCNVLSVGELNFRNYDTHHKWHKYKDYRSVVEYYKSWNIVPVSSLQASLYWKWVFSQFSKEFAKYHVSSCSKIPLQWKIIMEEDVKNSIKIMFKDTS